MVGTLAHVSTLLTFDILIFLIEFSANAQCSILFKAGKSFNVKVVRESPYVKS